jgi:hypothetical protein
MVGTHHDRKEVHVFRPKHTALLAGAVTTLALGGAGVAIAASGGNSSSNSSGAATTATTKTTTTSTTSSSSSHCDHDNASSSGT